ncbi:MAG: Rrf2 family transcriptional regulator [Candidatus Omnitrophica bacterium]|nr:Rrf2 family transcriptional regulator [Candidatus Omnitrophota bacterium]
MKLLTKDSDYAIRTLMHLALHPHEFISTKQISDGQGMPYQFLRRIVQKLISHNLVESKEGIRGGIKIKREPEDIKIIDVMQIFQGPVQLSACMFRNKLCENRANCVLRRELQRIESIVRNEFRDVSIQKLINGIKG